MPFYSKDSKSLGWIVYSRYGMQSHVIMNTGGVVFTINPKTDEAKKAVTYETRFEADMARTPFYDQISEVVLIAIPEKY